MISFCRLATLIIALYTACGLFAPAMSVATPATPMECPANHECTEPSFSQWCHGAGPTSCGTGAFETCDDLVSNPLATGTRTFTEQVVNNFALEYLCNGFASSAVSTPTSGEMCFNCAWRPGYEVQKIQLWNIHLVFPDGHESDVGRSPQAERSMTCQPGFDLVSYGNAAMNAQKFRCQKARIATCDPNCPTGKPVLPFAQEKLLTTVDFEQAGFELTRRYNSQSRAFQDAPQGTSFGPKWSSNWELRLLVDDLNEVRALRRDGTQITFSLNAGQWLAWKGEPTKLIAIGGSPPDGVVWKIEDPSGALESYDLSGRLLSIGHIDGRRFELTYDSGGYLADVSARDGRKISFAQTTYGATVRITSAALPDGTTIVYGYNDWGSRLETVADGQGLRGTYVYNEPGNSAYTGSDRAYLLTGIVDPSGQRYSTYKYNVNGLVTESGLAGGASVSTFALGSNYVDITSSVGIERRVFSMLAGAQRVTEVKLRPVVADPLIPERTRTYTYDANGYKDLVTDFKGTVTDHDYDPRGLELSRVEAKGKDTQPANVVSEERKVVTAWHTGFRVPTERNVYKCSAPSLTIAQPCSGAGGSNLWQLESLSRFAYNIRGQSTARCEVDPGNTPALAYICGSATNAPSGVRQSLTSYCESADVAAPGSTCPLLGLVKSMDGARTNATDVTTYSYYAADASTCATTPTTCAYRKGDLWKMTNALGQITEYVSYDGAGRVKRMKDANAVLTDLTYHARGWLLTRTVRANLSGVPSAGGDAVTTLTYLCPRQPQFCIADSFS